jgi:MarR family transcriptional regulator, organic hydroperoxide resistance regulator
MSVSSLTKYDWECNCCKCNTSLRCTMMPAISDGQEMKPTKSLSLADYVPYLVNRVGAALVTRFSSEALEKYDLSIAMWRVLLNLASAGAQRLVDLSDQTSVEVSTLSRLVSKLAQKGLVTRARAENSNREVTIALTSKGNELVSELIPVARHLEQTAISHLSSKELVALKKILRQIYQNLTQSPTISQDAKRTGTSKKHAGCFSR